MGFKFSKVVFLLCILLAVFQFGQREVGAHDIQDCNTDFRTRTGKTKPIQSSWQFSTLEQNIRYCDNFFM